jgi:hypothetical protein
MNESDPPSAIYPSPQIPTVIGSSRDELKGFLELFFTEQQRPDLLAARWAEIEAAFADQKQPALSRAELEHAGRVAWRNSTRCIGRLFWKSLIVRDMRHLEAEDDIVASLIEHLKVAFNGGAGLRRESSLAKMKQEIEAEYLADMSAIARLKTLNSVTEGNGVASKGQSAATAGAARHPRDKIGPIAAVREAVAALADGFTTRDVQQYIELHHPNAKIAGPSIFSAMHKMKTQKEPEIAVVKQNQGREPGTYKKVVNEKPAA